MMKVAAPVLDCHSLHYYTVPESGWPPKADPVNFDETAWADTLHETWRMDELISKHAAIMDKRSEEHTSELQSLMRISYAVFCLKKKRKRQNYSHETETTSPISASNTQTQNKNN